MGHAVRVVAAIAAAVSVALVETTARDAAGARDVLAARGVDRASDSQLPLDARHESGQGVTAGYEGWFRNADGTFSLLVGYFNRNYRETLDIPVGPDNRFEPGPPDRMQPTHFLPRRQWGVFSVVVPADFGQQRLTWTLSAHGRSAAIPMGLNPLYEISPLKDPAQGNTPPVLKFDPSGAVFQGPPSGFAASYSAKVGDPLTLAVWATDDAVIDPDRKAGEPPVTLSWSLYRGAPAVVFSNAKPAVGKPDGKAVATATFGQPGEYVLRLQANDVSGEGGGGFQCCWTNAHVKVTVQPKSLFPLDLRLRQTVTSRYHKVQ